MLSRAARAPSAAAKPETWLGGAWKGETTAVRMQRVLLAAPPVQSGAAADAVEQLLTDPVYQLK